jgi:hypothetical protein
MFVTYLNTYSTVCTFTQEVHMFNVSELPRPRSGGGGLGYSVPDKTGFRRIRLLG